MCWDDCGVVGRLLIFFRNRKGLPPEGREFEYFMCGRVGCLCGGRYFDVKFY